VGVCTNACNIFCGASVPENRGTRNYSVSKLRNSREDVPTEHGERGSEWAQRGGGERIEQ